MLDAAKVDPYTLTSFFPRNTGLPMTVWAQVGVGRRTRPRLLLSGEDDGHRWPDHFRVVEIEPEPPVFHEALITQSRRVVERWVALNREALLEHWTGRFDSADLAEATRSL